MEWAEPDALAGAENHLDVAGYTAVAERRTGRIDGHLHGGLVQEENRELIDEHEAEGEDQGNGQGKGDEFIRVFLQ